MEAPRHIAFHNLATSPALEALIRREATKLERIAGKVVRWRVVVEAPHHRHHKGNQFFTTIHLTLPRTEVVVTREPGDEHLHEDAYLSVRDAFREATRQVEDLHRRRKARAARRAAQRERSEPLG